MMKVSLVVAALAAAASFSDRAEQYVDDFAKTCIAANGDLEAMKQVMKSAGYLEKKFAYPQSLMAKRKSNVLVYRGGMADHTPQCSIQTDRVPGGDFDRLASLVEQRLTLSGAAKDTTCNGRPIWRWRSRQNDRAVSIMLVDDRLLGEPNIRLGVMPWSEEERDCSKFKVKVTRESE